MIEVTQKDHKGRIQSRDTYTECQFGYAYAYRTNDIISMFGIEHTMIGSRETLVEGTRHTYRRYAEFKLVAYNEKGKVLDPSYLVGLANTCRWNRYLARSHHYETTPGTKRCKRHVRGSALRCIHTTPERRATFACEDQEEYVPRVRCRRNNNNLPESWDDYWRYNQKNWKQFRNQQWKEKRLHG